MANDYKTISVDGRTVLEHRHVWALAHGPIPAGMQVHHKNGNKRDNRLENLELLTPAEHGKEHRKHPSVKLCVVCSAEFEPHPARRGVAIVCSDPCRRVRASEQRSALTPEQRAELCRRIGAGERQSDLARGFGVAESVVTNIKRKGGVQVERSDRKVPEAQRAEIRARIAAGEKQRDLAAEYGVTPATITRIKQAVSASLPA